MQTGKSNRIETGKSKINFYLCIYHEIKSRGKISHICKREGISKQNLKFYSDVLKDLKIIARVDPKNVYLGWKVLQELSDDQILKQVKVKSKTGKSKSSIGSRKPVSNLHALQINFPILSGKINDKDWDAIQGKFNNWLPKYKDLDILGGLKLKNNNNKSVTVFVKSRDFDGFDNDYIDNLAFKVRAFAHEYFKNKHGVVLDVLNCATKNMNIATSDKHGEGMLKKGEVFTLDLEKKSEKIFPKDDINAKAWLDGSPFKFTAETNDKEWKRAYLQMPFSIQSLLHSMPAIQEYSKNIMLHMEVQDNQLATQKSIQELLEKLDQSIQELTRRVGK